MSSPDELFDKERAGAGPGEEIPENQVPSPLRVRCISICISLEHSQSSFLRGSSYTDFRNSSQHLNASLRAISGHSSFISLMEKAAKHAAAVRVIPIVDRKLSVGKVEQIAECVPG